MNFTPTTDPRNWRTRSRSALTARGQVLHLSQSVDEPEIRLGDGRHEFTFTPNEAFKLGAELMAMAVAAKKEPTCTQG